MYSQSSTPMNDQHLSTRGNLSLPIVTLQGDRTHVVARRPFECARRVLRTLIFYDLFHCPLRIEELVQRTFEGLPDAWRVDPQAMIEADPILSQHVSVARGYVFLRTASPAFDRWESAERERRRCVWRYEKWVRMFCRIPFVRTISVTGSLAFPMPSGKSDCDLFVVTNRNRLWIVVALSRLMFYRILPMLKLIQCGEICPNYMIDEDAAIASSTDLFDSMQLAAMNPVMGNDAHERFVEKHLGLRQFFPRWQPPTPLFPRIVQSPPLLFRRWMERALWLLPLDALNQWLHRHLSRRFTAQPVRKEEAMESARTASRISAGWIRQAFDLTARSYRFSIHEFKVHGGQKLALLARLEDALCNHPAASSIDLTGDRGRE